MLFTINIVTHQRNELIDITHHIKDFVQKSNVKSGLVVVHVPHTTAAVSINENADPSVKSDIVKTMNSLIPQSNSYSHYEGNSDAHIKSSLFGPQLSLIIENGELLLGTWQGIIFCEFDGPRHRKCYVKIFKDQ